MVPLRDLSSGTPQLPEGSLPRPFGFVAALVAEVVALLERVVDGVRVVDLAGYRSESEQRREPAGYES